MHCSDKLHLKSSMQYRITHTSSSRCQDLGGVITVNGNTERSLRTEEHTAALAAEAQSSLLRQTTNSAIQPPNTFKRVWSKLQQDRLARSELA